MTNTKQPKSWRDQIKVHPAADLFPMMPPDELKALGEDIKETWLRTNIAVWQADEGRPWFLLDGRNRLDAAELVGLSVEFIKRAGEVTVKIGDHIWAVDDITSMDPYEWVISANVHRRHLTPELKRDVIAALLKANPDKSDRRIAKEAASNRTTVGQVRKELEDTGTCQSVDTRTDTKGRKQPTNAKRRDIAEKKARLPGKDADASASALDDLSERIAYAETPALADDGNGGVTVTLPEDWREELPKAAKYIGVPEGELAGFLMELGLRAFNRALRLSPRMNKDGNVEQPAMPNGIAWWLIEMHSKYPDTFNVGSWEGSCGYLAIDKLYAARGVPIGKFREWQQAERNKDSRREAKPDAASPA